MSETWIKRKKMDKAKMLAEEHWEWVEKIVHILCVDFFIHGYKHSKDDMLKDFQSLIDIIYIAGLFDGEGYITIQKPHSGSRSHVLEIGICNTNKEIIDFVHNVLKVGHVDIKTYSNEKWRPLYRWIANSRQALKVLEKILPFLKVKKKQAELAIEFQKNIKRISFRISSEELNRREKLREQITLLNRGIEHGLDDANKRKVKDGNSV